jgi:hypothetical protein
LFRSTRGAAPAAARGFQSSAAKSLKLQPEANVEVGTALAPHCARSAALGSHEAQARPTGVSRWHKGRMTSAARGKQKDARLCWLGAARWAPSV